VHEFAALLGYKAAALTFLLYKMPSADKYVTFSIPKKSGGQRTIDAPTTKLKALQRSLADLLLDCRIDIEASKPPHQRRPLSHGFRIGHSTLTNARQHRRRRYVFNQEEEALDVEIEEQSRGSLSGSTAAEEDRVAVDRLTHAIAAKT